MINRLFNKIGLDGCKHIIVSVALTKLFAWFLPVSITAVIVLFIGALKELYDKLTDNGVSEWKDFYCNIFGVILAIL